MTLVNQLRNTYQPLRDNPAHVARLCALLDLGRPARPPRRLGGGFHHLVWRLDTDRCRWVIKQLSPDTDLQDPAVVAHFNASEAVAEKFSTVGVGAIHALRHDRHYLQLLDGTGYLVFPWTDARALEKGCVSRPHALTVARLLAQMHRANISASGLALAAQQAVPEADIAELVGLAKVQRLDAASELERRLPHLRTLCSAQAWALQTLAHHQVVGHGDLDQKNVLWDADGQPVLIDWESARRLNPTYETVQEALDWSGLLSRFDRALFGEFVATYRACGGPLERGEASAALHCILGDWLDWLAYNVGRCLNLDDPGQRAVGHEQIALVLSTLTLLETLTPELLSILEKQDSQS